VTGKANLEAQMSAALAPAHAEALEAVRGAAAKNVDETSWKLAGKLCWLWLAATGTVAVFLIHAHRGWDALVALLGEEVQGFVCSDRWCAYAQLSPWCRQVCWAHLKRDFQKLVDRGGPAARLGEDDSRRVHNGEIPRCPDLEVRPSQRRRWTTSSSTAAPRWRWTRGPSRCCGSGCRWWRS
jgi:hypothetical protein